MILRTWGEGGSCGPTWHVMAMDEITPATKVMYHLKEVIRPVRLLSAITVMEMMTTKISGL